MSGRLLIAVSAAAAVAVASPFVGELNSALERTFPGQYRAIVLAAVLVPASMLVGAAFLRIGERRALRYGLLVAGLAIAVLYATVMQTTRTEQFHFTEYAVLTALFYRAWRWRNDVSSVILPACAAAIAGVGDEWFQWFVPSRVGEARDLVLNGVGVVSGLLVAFAIDPLPRLAPPAGPSSRRAIALGVTALLLALATFFDVVHVGYEIADAEAGTFRSRYSAETLREVAADRAARWHERPPVTRMPLVSREDHFLSEAAFHVQWRNDAASRGDMWTAWHENLILERFYGPVLDTGLPGTRWSPEQRANMQTAASADSRAYASGAYPFPMYAWNPWLYRGLTLVLVGVLCALVL